MKSKAEPKPTVPTLVHNLINKLSVIIGNCDLLIEQQPGGTETTNRLVAIGDTARSVADQLAAQLEVQAAKVQRRKAS